MPSRRHSLVRFVIALLLGLCGLQASAAWPDRPVSLIVPWPAGGSTDVMARMLSPLLSEQLGQPVIVVNRAGATGNMGAEFVLQQPADGYNIFFGAASHLINSALYAHNGRALRYDIVTQFDWCAAITDSRMVVVVNPKVPANNLRELVELTRRSAPPLSYSSAGAGSIQHLSGELFLRTADLTMLHVPYKGIAPSINDLVAGTVDVSFESLYPLLPFIKTGKLRALATLTADPVPGLDGVPTAISQGYPGLVVAGPQFVGVPKGTPLDISSRITRAFETVFANPEVVRRLEEAGLVVSFMRREEATRMIRSERDKWAKLIEKADIKVD
ncbi:tripartite tricarboxylate transporter substrate binding protein [Variovorax sp. KK3]|uniref:Bug family tripartite tricarboxylate transporter substrate binding protein n=1 Tax=Variovorax sp. KK3 TaxID=1855728 RepID=UPI00097C318F|nr:tripartite tricarboxylate transporter substrate binding protein [Variovorax sp. KK3]